MNSEHYSRIMWHFRFNKAGELYDDIIKEDETNMVYIFSFTVLFGHQIVSCVYIEYIY